MTLAQQYNAMVKSDCSVEELEAFTAQVCVFDKTYSSIKINGWYSMTTGRHIRSFLAYLGVNTEGLLKGVNCRSFKQFVEKYPEFTLG